MDTGNKGVPLQCNKGLNYFILAAASFLPEYPFEQHCRADRLAARDSRCFVGLW